MAKEQELFNELADFLGGTTRAQQFVSAVKADNRKLAKVLLNNTPVTGAAGGEVTDKDLDETIKLYDVAAL